MTQRYGINRQSDYTTTSSRQLNSQSAATAAKSADVERFNAAMRAKEDINQQSKDNAGKSEVQQHCELSANETRVAPGALTASNPVPVFSGTNFSAPVNPAPLNQPSGMSSTGGSITLALTLPSGTTQAVQQATTIIHRIIQTNAGLKDSRTWNLQLSIDGIKQYTICVQYHGKTDWAIGLLDEKGSSTQQPFDDLTNEQSDFTRELRQQLQSRNPSLQISSLRAGRYT